MKQATYRYEQTGRSVSFFILMRARAKSRRLITAILGLQATEHKPLQRLIFS